MTPDSPAENPWAEVIREAWEKELARYRHVFRGIVAIGVLAQHEQAQRFGRPH
jgi:hypothetical protein